MVNERFAFQSGAPLFMFRFVIFRLDVCVCVCYAAPKTSTIEVAPSRKFDNLPKNWKSPLLAVF